MLDNLDLWHLGAFALGVFVQSRFDLVSKIKELLK